MSELQEMQTRIAPLEQETVVLQAKSKAQTLRQRFVMGLAVVGVGMALMAPKGSTQAPGQGQTAVAANSK